MASRLPSLLRTSPLSKSLSPLRLRCSTFNSPISRFSTTPLRLQDAAAPVKRPVGAFRGSLFGFLAGAVGAGAAVYYYILEEYRALQAAVQRIESYVRTLEEELGKKK